LILYPVAVLVLVQAMKAYGEDEVTVPIILKLVDL